MLPIFCKYYVYLIRSKIFNKFYIGYTTNIKKRLRQHNGEISGGAKKTQRHRPWEYVLYITGFPYEKTALQYEFCIHKERKIICNEHIKSVKKKLRGVNRFIYIMKYFLKKDRICKTAPLNNTFRPIIFFANNSYYSIWNGYNF